MEAILLEVASDPKVQAAAAALLGSLVVALSNAGGEKFALIRRLGRVVLGALKRS